MARREINPQMPFIQVDQNVGARAAQLAARIGVSYQHARGALDIFWESLADRRILAGKTKVILTPGDCLERLRLAFGCPVDIQTMVSAGFLEVDPEGFRVRGMSRYLKAEAKRDLLKKSSNSDVGPDLTSAPAHAGHSPASAPPQPRRVEREELRVESSKEKETSSATRPPDVSETLSLLSPEDDARTSVVNDIVLHYLKALGASGYGARDTEDKHRLVRKCLGDGWPPEQLKAAIDGLTWSDWHMGRDKKTNGKRYCTLDYAIGDAAAIERFSNEQQARERHG